MKTVITGGYFVTDDGVEIGFDCLDDEILASIDGVQLTATELLAIAGELKRLTSEFRGERPKAKGAK